MANPPATSTLTAHGRLQRDDNETPVGWTYANVTTTTTGTVIKAGPGILHSITFNTPTATAVITLYDNASAASGTTIGQVTVATGQPCVTVIYDLTFLTGLTIKVATAASDLTISYI
jgi:hypothetical protein